MKTILVIEDEGQLQEACRLKLEHEHYRVMQAATAQEATKVMQSLKPDLILLDLMLPGGQNGFDILEKLRSSERSSDIPVIVLSNLDSEKDTVIDMGASEYLLKSNTSLEEIVERIKVHLRE